MIPSNIGPGKDPEIPEPERISPPKPLPEVQPVPEPENDPGKLPELPTPEPEEFPKPENIN